MFCGLILRQLLLTTQLSSTVFFCFQFIFFCPIAQVEYSATVEVVPAFSPRVCHFSHDVQLLSWNLYFVFLHQFTSARSSPIAERASLFALNIVLRAPAVESLLWDQLCPLTSAKSEGGTGERLLLLLQIGTRAFPRCQVSLTKSSLVSYRLLQSEVSDCSMAAAQGDHTRTSSHARFALLVVLLTFLSGPKNVASAYRWQDLFF